MSSPTAPILDQNVQVKAYLQRKKRENGNERLRLAKAMQWYFFYGAMITTAIFLIHNYPNVLNIFSSISSYTVVVVFYILMYGMVFLAYMTTPWPYPILYEKAAVIKGMNWSPQLCWVERLMTMAYYSFFIGADLMLYVKKDYWGAIILATLQFPHVLTSAIGFPKRLSAQLGCIVLRFLGLIFSIAHLHISFSYFNRFQTLGISGILGALPFALLVGMYFNGRVDKRPAHFFFGKKRRDLVIMTVAGISFFFWEGILCFMVFIYNTPSWPFPNLHWMPINHPLESLPDFLEVCVVACMTVLSIPLMYHGLLGIREQYPKTDIEKERALLQRSESARLIDICLPQTAPANFMDEIALVIACHKSKDNIIKTLHAAHYFAHFPKVNIYVAHNAGKDEPIDETGPVVWADEEWIDVHYIYIPVGNKSVAMDYIIQNYVKPAGIPLVVMIDDDVLFPPDIDLRGGYEQIMYDDKVKAVAFTIRGIEESNFWQKFQHLEYMQAGLLKMFQGNFGSVLTCHGAISLWEVQACCDVFALHNTEFHGEDLQMGLILRKMNKEYRIEANAVGPVATASPKSLMYETAANEKSLFSQRVFSWDMAAHHFFLDFLTLTFVNWEKAGLILKPFLLIELWTMLQDWLRFVFLTAIFKQDPWNAVALVGTLVLLQMVIVLIFDKLVLSHRTELQSPTYICILYPIFNILTVGFRFVGLLYNSLYYTPWNPPRILIKDRRKLGMIPPAVEEPRGTPVEREAFWKTVWKLDTYTKRAAVDPVPLNDEVAAVVASVAQALIEGPAGEEKRQEQVEEKQDARVQLQVQGPVLEGQKSESIFVDVDEVTPGKPIKVSRRKYTDNIRPNDDVESDDEHKSDFAADGADVRGLEKSRSNPPTPIMSKPPMKAPMKPPSIVFAKMPSSTNVLEKPPSKIFDKPPSKIYDRVPSEVDDPVPSSDLLTKSAEMFAELTPRGKNRRVKWDDTASFNNIIEALQLDPEASRVARQQNRQARV